MFLLYKKMSVKEFSIWFIRWGDVKEIIDVSYECSGDGDGCCQHKIEFILTNGKYADAYRYSAEIYAALKHFGRLDLIKPSDPECNFNQDKMYNLGSPFSLNGKLGVTIY